MTLRVIEIVDARFNEPIAKEQFFVSTKFGAKTVYDSRTDASDQYGRYVPAGEADIVKYIDDQIPESAHPQPSSPVPGTPIDWGIGTVGIPGVGAYKDGEGAYGGAVETGEARG